MKTYNVAIIGATGAVGKSLLEWLIKYEFPYKNITLFASKSSAGKEIVIDNQKYIVKELDDSSFMDIDICFFTSKDEISKKFIPLALKYNCFVIDNSKTYRLLNDVPLVVGSVNDYIIKPYHRLIANPNCATAILCSVIHPINEIYKIKQIVLTTYQSISGMGFKAIDSFKKHTLAFLNKNEYKDDYFDYSFNIYPQIGDLTFNNLCYEEYKIIEETKKILNVNIPIFPMCVRVPTINCHGEAVHLEFDKVIDIDNVITTLQKKENIIALKDKLVTNKEVKNQPLVYVSRIKQLTPTSLDLFIISDNLLVGAATNAIKIAFSLIREDNHDFL